MLFPAKDYHLNRWHHQLRGEVAEDLGIMKAVKEAGLMANGLLSCRMYQSFNQAVMGFSKNFMAPFDNRLSLFLTFVITVLLGPLVIILTGELYQIILLVLLILLIRFYTSKLAGENWRINFPLHPLQMLSFLIISSCAIYQHIFRSSSWKGRTVSPIPTVG